MEGVKFGVVINKVSAMDAAKWFIQKNLDNPRNTFDGNMKLQKLLYFAQLIHLANHGEVLFEEPILAFENGSVVEQVRLTYRDEQRGLMNDAIQTQFEFDPEQFETLELTEEIFGGLSARELSDINHMHQGWKDAYERSFRGRYRFKGFGLIRLDEMIEKDLPYIKEMLKAYEMTREQDEVFEVVNGIKFYYDPNEIEINEDILHELQGFNGTESAYSLYIDEEQGLVIF